MANLFRRNFRSKDRDRQADEERLSRLCGLLEELIAETRREYEGLGARIRHLGSAEVDRKVYPLGGKPAEAGGDAGSKSELDMAVERTRKLLKQISLHETLIAQVRDAKAKNVF